MIVARRGRLHVKPHALLLGMNDVGTDGGQVPGKGELAFAPRQMSVR